MFSCCDVHRLCAVCSPLWPVFYSSPMPCGFEFVFGRGAGSKAWSQVSMIKLVKKFGRARLSTDFLGKKRGRLHKQKAFVKFCNGLLVSCSNI